MRASPPGGMMCWKRSKRMGFNAMKSVALLLATLALGSCNQGAKTIPYTAVIGIEIEDSREFFEIEKILEQQAALAPNYHVDGRVDLNARPQADQSSEEDTQIILLAVWEGKWDKQVIASAETYGRRNFVTVTFNDPYRSHDDKRLKAAIQFRENTEAALMQAFPSAAPVELLSNGTLPNSWDITRMDDGYRISEEARPKYRNML